MQLGFRSFAWAPNSQKYEDSTQQQKLGDPPFPPTILGEQRGEFSKGDKNFVMTCEGLGEMFEGDFGNMCANKFSWGDERSIKHAQPVSEDPHRRERNFENHLTMQVLLLFFCIRRGYPVVVKCCMQF